MSYLKFAGISLVVYITAFVTAITFSLWFVLIPVCLVGGIILLMQPPHLKWGLGFWFVLSTLAVLGISKWIRIDYESSDRDAMGLSDFLFTLAAIILLNPVSYWIGKLTYSLLHKERAVHE